MLAIANLPIIIILIVLFSESFEVSAQQRAYVAPEFAEDWSKPDKHPDHIMLNFSQDPSESASVTWRTSPDVTRGFAEIAIASAAPKFWRNAMTIEAKTETMDASEIKTAEVVSYYHSVTFTGLVPDTLYAYRVGDGKIWSEWIQFRTAAKTSKPFSFLYVGDAQNYILELWSRLIREGYRKAPDASFIIHAGDLVNDAHSERQWHEWFTAGGWIHRMLPSIPIPGNHEYRPLNAEQEEQKIRSLSAQWRSQFTLPENGPEIPELKETVFYTDYQDLRVISLNSNLLQEEQVEWLEAVLKNNPKKWVAVTYHHPLFSASSGRDNAKLRSLWKPLFDKYKVDLALQGHDHSYARGRTEPYLAEGEHNLMDGLNARDYTGTVYVVSVSGGKMYKLRPNAWEGWDAQRDRAAENTQLVQLISIDGDMLSYQSYTATGELYDAFDLIKQRHGKPNKFVERRGYAIDPRRHENTINYEDQLPLAIRQELEQKYAGYQIDRINYLKEQDFTGYKVELKNGNTEIALTLSEDGKILQEVVKQE